MSESIKCPCCGSENIAGNIWHETNKKMLFSHGCNDCFTRWNESKRKPVIITPEMAWDWFCKRQFARYASMVVIMVDECGDLYFMWSDGNILQGLDHCMVGDLGWQSMPPMTRKDLVNE